MNVQRLAGEQTHQQSCHEYPITHHFTFCTENIIMFHDHLILSPELKAVCVGTLLGDASIQTQSYGKSYRLKYQMKSTHQDYVDLLYKEFGKEWIPSSPHLITRKNSSMIGFQTLSTSALVPVAKLFHLFGKKNEKKRHITGVSGKRIIRKSVSFLVYG